VAGAYQGELEAALEAVNVAGRDVLERYAHFTKIPDAPASISTEADRQAQEIILRHLLGAFPGDAVCAEEATPTLATSAHQGQRLWVVDPIDGTRGFARKNGEFSLMIAFVDAGCIAVGVVLEPVPDRLTYATAGGGCWRRDGAGAEPVRCRVSAVADLAEATLVQSRSRNPGQPTWPVQVLRPARVVETYSAGIKLARVARGEADVYVNTYDAFHDWDICAGHILVAEAGGRVTGLAGQELRYGLPGALQANGLLATNGLLHETATAQLGAARRFR
jgi:3'(2'), 5'-bisphosphate nucleotidase